MANYIVNGKHVSAIKTDECDERYIEYDIFHEDTVIGCVTKYRDEILYSVWDKENKLKGTGKTIEEAITHIFE